MSTALLPPLHCSSHVIIVDKPAGWLTVPSREGAKDPRPCLGRVLESAHGRLWPVHRLDLEVSGLVLFARSAEAHRHISDWFERRRVKKVYEALTSGDRQGEALSETWNTWTCRMARGKKRAYLADFGKPAETLARCVGERVVQGVTLLAWELFPKTGRPHQLRFELARRQWPIAGDTLYGSTTRWREGEIALRARRLDFGECPEFARWGLPQTIECLSWQEREGDQE